MKKMLKTKLFMQVAVSAMIATLATAGIAGAATSFGNNINTAGTLSATGAAALYGATSVGGALTATSTLSVTGATTLSGLLTASGGIVMTTASSTGLAKFDSLQLTTALADAYVANNITASNYLPLAGGEISGNLDITGSITFTSDSFLVDEVNISAIPATYATKLSPIFTGTTNFYGATSIGGALTATSTLSVDGATTLGGLLTANGGMVMTTASSTGLAKFDSLQLTSALGAAYGGTGLASYTIGDMLYASGATTLSKLAGIATGNALISGGVGAAPSWDKINLATTATGTLAVANGGTGITGVPTYGQILIGNGTNYSLIATSTLGINLVDTTGSISIANGGTGQTTYLTGDILYASGVNTLSKLGASADGYVLTLSGGVPTWVATTTLSTISGTLAVANGGTGITGVPTYGQILIGNGTNYSLIATSTLGINLVDTTGSILVANGGTGVTSFGGNNTLLYTTALNTLSSITNTTDGYILTLSGGVPTWVATTTLLTISGILPLANGGTNGIDASSARINLGLGNVTNESKATMFTSPTLTGTVNVNGFATTTPTGVFMPGSYATSISAPPCSAELHGGIIYNATGGWLCVCNSSVIINTWKLATSTTESCFLP